MNHIFTDITDKTLACSQHEVLQKSGCAYLSLCDVQKCVYQVKSKSEGM